MIKRILDLLSKHNISAKKLTDDLQLSNSAVTDWKKGKARPSVDAIIKIAKYFNVTTDYLLGLENSRYNEKECFYIEDIKTRIKNIAKEKNRNIDNFDIENLNIITISKLADFLNCSTDYLYGRSSMDIDIITNEINVLFNNLNQDARKQALKYAEYLLSQQKTEKEL